MSLELNSIEAIAAISQVEAEFQSKIDAAKEACTAIYKKFKAREEKIAENVELYMDAKVADLQANLREATRQSLEELVKAKGFAKQIADCREELERDDQKNDVQQMIQVVKEVELRGLILAAGNDAQMKFAPLVASGDPLVISAIENSPIDLGFDEGLLADGKERRKEVLKPVIARRYHLLLEAQAVIEGFANSIMPIKPGDIDPITTLSAGN